MLLQATLNGDLTKADHRAVPVSQHELALDAAACVVAGAGAIHVHPRDISGREQLSAEVVDRLADAVKAKAGVPVGVSTGAWIEPDLERRIALIRRWRAPDYASVNVSEPGSFEVMRACQAAGVGIEAGVWSVEDAKRLMTSGLARDVLRILIEPVDVLVGQALALVSDIHAVLDNYDMTAPRLQHGDGDATWILLRDAVRRGIDTRIGLEDTTRGPDGEVVTANADLVRAAVHLGAGDT